MTNVRGSARVRLVGIGLAVLAWQLVATGARGSPHGEMEKRQAVAPSNDDSFDPTLTPDGRFVLFDSGASNLVRGDTNERLDVFMRDRVARTTERVSLGRGTLQARGSSGAGGISANGRFVVFVSDAPNLVARDTNHQFDVFVRDRVAKTTERVSVSSSGVEANKGGHPNLQGPAISADGRFVTFDSAASNLVEGDTNDEPDVFVHDLVTRSTERVSVGDDGAQATDASYSPAISADGRFVTFVSEAPHLVAGDRLHDADVFARDRVAGTTERVSLSTSGADPDEDANAFQRAITADGRLVVFQSTASNLVTGDTNNQVDVFLRDRALTTTELVSVSNSGAQANESSAYGSISADGQFVAFQSQASNLVPNDRNSVLDVFVRDRVAGTTTRVSVSTRGASANGDSYGGAVTADGRLVAFESEASNLVDGDTNSSEDVFVHDRLARTTTLVSVGRKVNLRAGQLILQPRPARAGRPLRAAFRPNLDGVPFETAGVQCRAFLPGRSLRTTTRRFLAGRAQCVWRIPPRARGKRLRASVSVTTSHGTISRRFTGIVR